MENRNDLMVDYGETIDESLSNQIIEIEIMRNKAGSMTYNNSYILGHLKRYDLEKLKWHGCSKQKIFLGS